MFLLGNAYLYGTLKKLKFVQSDAYIYLSFYQHLHGLSFSSTFIFKVGFLQTVYN